MAENAVEVAIREYLQAAQAAGIRARRAIPCGEREWETDQTRPILEIARREGVIIAA